MLRANIKHLPVGELEIISNKDNSNKSQTAQSKVLKKSQIAMVYCTKNWSIID